MSGIFKSTGEPDPIAGDEKIPEPGKSNYRSACIRLGIIALFCAGWMSCDGLFWGQDPKPLSDSAQAEILYQKIQTTIFDPVCALCHAGETPAQGMDLTAARSQEVIRMYSTEIPAMLVVYPGHPDSSYMIWKLEGRPGITGQSMPWGMEKLPPDQIKLIREWIRLLGSYR